MSLDQRIRSTLESEASATSHSTPVGAGEAMRRGTRRRRVKKTALGAGGLVLFAGMLAFLGTLDNRQDVYVGPGEELLLTNPVVVRGAPGPEPLFSAEMGEEMPLAEVTDLSALVEQVERSFDGELVRITALGTTPAGRTAAVVYLDQTDPELGDLRVRCLFDGSSSSCGGSSRDEFAGLPGGLPPTGQARDGVNYTSGGPGVLMWDVPEGASVVVFDANGVNVWQRPVGRVAAFDTDLREDDRFVVTAVDIDGEILEQLTYTVPNDGDGPVPGADASRFDSVHDMRDLLREDGFECSQWSAITVPGLPNQNEIDSAICSLHTEFFIFRSAGARSNVLDMVQQNDTLQTNDGRDSFNVHGDNWVVHCEVNERECEQIHAILGGTLSEARAEVPLPEGYLPSLYCNGFDPHATTGKQVAFYALCDGSPTLPPVPIYRPGSQELSLQEALEALVAGAAPDEETLGFFDWVDDSTVLTAVSEVDSDGVAHVDFLEDGERWQPGQLAGTSNQLFSLLDPLMATVFHFPEVTAIDHTTLCWGEARCSGVTTRETWESINFINAGVIASDTCSLERAWSDPATCTVEGALVFQHMENVANVDTVALRAGPGEVYVEVGEVTLGEMVAVIDLFTKDEGWRLVATEGGFTLGWMPAEYLEKP